MNRVLGIRREDKNIWERRVPLSPRAVEDLIRSNLRVLLQPAPGRAFPDREYLQSGAEIEEDLTPAQVIFAIKEIPLSFFQPGRTYMFFSHTVKGQAYNMPMLQRMMDLKCTLIDYEKVVDDQGKRLIFFGKFAGLAGMIDSLWTLGRKLEKEGTSNPFSALKQAHHYPDLNSAKQAVKQVGEEILAKGLPQSMPPFICAFLGYGNVSVGAQEIFNLLPYSEIKPEEILSVYKNPDSSRHTLYKVVFKEENLVEPVDPQKKFELADYYQHPENYHSRFYRYLPYLGMIINGIYWEKRYPKFVTCDALDKLYRENRLPLKVIGDISCDIGGAMECTIKATVTEQPVFTYHPGNRQIIDDFAPDGIAVMSVDNLPCELPKESSEVFSLALEPYVPSIVKADYGVEFADLNLPPAIKNAVILHQGCLTPNFGYLGKFLPQPSLGTNG